MEKSPREQSQYAGFQAKRERTLLKVLTVVQEEEISGRSDKESSFQAEFPVREDAQLRLEQVVLCSVGPMVYEWCAFTVLGMHLCLPVKTKLHAHLPTQP